MSTVDEAQDLARRVLANEPGAITADPLLLAYREADFLSVLLCGHVWRGQMLDAAVKVGLEHSKQRIQSSY